MSFNHSLNLNEIVKSLYPNIRRHVLLSLVGSINATLVNAADTAVRRIMEFGYDFKELTIADVEQLMSAPDFLGADDVLAEWRKLYLTRTEWADLLAQDTGDDTLGSISGTIDLLTGPQKARPINLQAIELLKTVGIEVTEDDVKAAAAQRQANDQFWADQRKERRGAVEWFIDHMLVRVDDVGDTDHYSQLTAESKERLVNKFVAALNKGITQATQNVLTGRAGAQDLGLADIPILRDLATRTMSTAWPIAGLPAEPVDAAKVQELNSKFRRAPRPTEAAPF
jgi:hypothetical protein